MAVYSARRSFTVTEYLRMAEAGILHEDDRIELIEGEIIEMSPVGSRHVACVNRLTTWLNVQLGTRAIVSAQNPVHLSVFSEPEPDVAVFKPRSNFYADVLPTAADTLLTIEVGDSSLEYDRRDKLPLYAQSGIPEVWIVNLRDDSVSRYTQPSGGKYQKSRRFRRGETVEATIVTGIAIDVVPLVDL